MLEATYVLKHFGTLVRQLAARLHADGRELIVTISYAACPSALFA